MNEEILQLGLKHADQLSKIKVDSRLLQPGDIFVALGQGHQFIHQALDKGVACVISEEWLHHERIQVVPDTVIWLANAARAYRNRLSAKVIAVTGSVGKTAVVQHLAHVLGQYASIHATNGNQNNEIGCSLTLLSTPKDCEYLIVEMGVAKPFDMDFLVDIVRPDIAVITQIGSTHLDQLGSNLGIWLEKSKIAMPNTALLCIEPNVFAHESRHPCYMVGYHDGYIQVGKQKLAINFIETSRRNQAVIAAVVAVLWLLKLPLLMSWPKLELAQRAQSKRHPNGALWIDDSYNASLLAFAHAIESLSLRAEKTVLVAGEMGGLGDHSMRVHRYLAHILNQADIDHVVFYGDSMYQAFLHYNGCAEYVANIASLERVLARYTSAEYVVWIKGSRHLELEQVIC